MLKTKNAARAMLLAAIIAFYPQNSKAEGFTGEAFLKWGRDSQDSLITYSITMTAIVASQGRHDIGKCIDTWYSGDEAVQKQRHDAIIEKIRENPTYHPQGVILAVLQKQCGSFKDKPN